MIVLIVALIAFAPGVATLAYFYVMDRYEPEPPRLILQTFLWGMLAAIAALFLEVGFALGPHWLQAVVLAPLIEEGAKFLAVRRTVYGNAEFDEPMDGIVYAAAAALGFASVENVAYLLQGARSHPELFTGLFYGRCLLSVPQHALDSSMWGYALGWRKQLPRLGRRFVLEGFGLAVFVHALFNGLTSLGFLGFALLSLGLVPVLWRVVHTRIVRSLAGSPHLRSASARVQAAGEPGGAATTLRDEGASPQGTGGERPLAHRKRYRWRRPSPVEGAIAFMGISVVLAVALPSAISIQRRGRESSMRARLRVARVAADNYVLQHGGYYPSAWSQFAIWLPPDWWRSPFGGRVDTVTVVRDSLASGRLRPGLAIYRPADFDPVRRRPRAAHFYGVSYRGQLLEPAGGTGDVVQAPGDRR